MEARALIPAWIVDDTGIPKKGKHSVGVARQYCGKLGKQDTCQVAVTLSVASDQASLPIAARLYLPEAWANDKERRKRAGVPSEIIVQTKPQIALSQIRRTIAEGVPRGIVLADAGYGNDTAFRDALTEMELSYVVGVQSSTAVWAPGTGPLPARPWSGHGRKTKLRRDNDAKDAHAACASEWQLRACAYDTVRLDAKCVLADQALDLLDHFLRRSGLTDHLTAGTVLNVSLASIENVGDVALLQVFADCLALAIQHSGYYFWLACERQRGPNVVGRQGAGAMGFESSCQGS
jgi:SRSO17 transposase